MFLVHDMISFENVIWTFRCYLNNEREKKPWLPDNPCLWWPAAPGCPHLQRSCTESSNCCHVFQCCRPVSTGIPAREQAGYKPAGNKNGSNTKSLFHNVRLLPNSWESAASSPSRCACPPAAGCCPWAWAAHPQTGPCRSCQSSVGALPHQW